MTLQHETNVIQNEEHLIFSFIYHIHAFLQVIETAYGFYKLWKNSNSKLLNGPQLVFKGLYFSVWMIYGIIGKNESLVMPIYVGIVLMQLMVYLILIKQWDYIVYEFTAIINTSWYMRQTTLDDLLLGCNIVSVLIMLVPLFHLYKAIKNQDPLFLSRYVYYIGFMEAISYFIYSCHRGYIAIAIAAIIKVFTMIVMRYVHKYLLLKLKESKKKE